jgi:hypothetical protein
MGTKKRHHYVPRFYLSGFLEAGESQLWVYEKGNAQPFRSTPENTGFQKHYYGFEKPDGTRDTNTIEDMYSKVEQSAAKVIAKIANRETIDGQAKANLAYFVAFQITRVPRFRKHVEAVDREAVKHVAHRLATDPEHFASVKRSYEEEKGKPLDCTFDEYKEFVERGMEVIIKPESSLPMALLLPQTMWRTIAEMKWQYVIAPWRQKFITTDSPVFYCNPRRPSADVFDTGLMDRNVELTVPLTREVALVARWSGKEGYTKANDSQVKRLNRQSILGCSRFVFSGADESWIPLVMAKLRKVQSRDAENAELMARCILSGPPPSLR